MKPILLLTAALASPAFAQDRFASGRVWDFNGREWSGIQLNRTTWRDLERNYDARPYTIHDFTLRMVPRDRAQVNVYAIFPEQREDARAEAIRLDYYGDEPTLEELARNMREKGQEYWHPARSNDWSLLAFRKSGVLAVVRGSGRERKATTYFLIEPSRFDQVLAPYSTRANERTVGGIVSGPYRDPDRWRGDFATYGRITVEPRVDGNMPRDMRSSDLRDFRTWAEDKFRSKNSGAMRFDDRSLGTIRITGRWNDFGRNSDEGDLDMEATFTGRSGENITVKDTYHLDINGNYRRAWENAVNMIIRGLENRTDERVRERRRDEDVREPSRRQYDRAMTMSEALEELARAAVGRSNFERGGRITDRRGG